MPRAELRFARLGVNTNSGEGKKTPGHWITKNGRRISIKGNGEGVAVAVAGLMVFGDAAAAESLGGNTAGDVVGRLPGRSMKARTESGQESAREGDATNMWSRLKFKELKRKLGRGADCWAAASGRVRESSAKTPCASLDRILLAVGDGHGDVAVVSVVRAGFKARARAGKPRQAETVQGSGDVRPPEAAVALGPPVHAGPASATPAGPTALARTLPHTYR
ncbi:hypothetical protein ACWEOE_29555 [Amycolatopsis sp. NPDC004368]